MNPRYHYRNSTLAFPKTTAYACAIDRPREKTWHWVAGCIALGVVFAALLFFGIRP